jgi:hypothetical protein
MQKTQEDTHNITITEHMHSNFCNVVVTKQETTILWLHAKCTAMLQGVVLTGVIRLRFNEAILCMLASSEHVVRYKLRAITTINFLHVQL